MSYHVCEQRVAGNVEWNTETLTYRRGGRVAGIYGRGRRRREGRVAGINETGKGRGRRRENGRDRRIHTSI